MNAEFLQAQKALQNAREALRDGNRSVARRWAEQAAKLAPQLEDPWLILAAVAFQGILVAGISYLVWFFLVHSYPISQLSAFTFLTPIFATIAGVVLLNEPLTLRLILSLTFVSIGIYVVNRR